MHRWILPISRGWAFAEHQWIVHGNASEGGGYLCYGSVFSPSLGLKPFVETQSSHGVVGELIKIWGEVGDATSVTFDGVSAQFKVVSSSLIAAKVPSSATSGTIRVLTPSGTLSSNTSFRVQQQGAAARYQAISFS